MNLKRNTINSKTDYLQLNTIYGTDVVNVYLFRLYTNTINTNGLTNNIFDYCDTSRLTHTFILNHPCTITIRSYLSIIPT